MKLQDKSTFNYVTNTHVSLTPVKSSLVIGGGRSVEYENAFRRSLTSDLLRSNLFNLS